MHGTARPWAMSRLRWRTPRDTSRGNVIMNLLELVFLYFEPIVNTSSRLRNLIE